MFEPLAVSASAAERTAHYDGVLLRLGHLLEGEDDPVAGMATVASELHHAFAYFNWTGFYRVHPKVPELLVLGPFQGGHGCLRIPFGQGVCGAVARTRQTLLVPDVAQFPGHIPCSDTTRSEVVVPVVTPNGRLLGVLDVDSDEPAAFDEADQANLEGIASYYAAHFYPRVKAAHEIPGSGLDLLLAMVRGEIAQAPICGTLDFALVEAERGRVVFEYTPAEHHYNPVGSVHGGVLATLCDSGTGAAVHSTLSAEQIYTSLEIKTSFLRPVTAKSGRLRCIGEVVNLGSRVATAEAKLLDKEGRLVAHATSTCLILSR